MAALVRNDLYNGFIHHIVTFMTLSSIGGINIRTKSCLGSVRSKTYRMCNYHTLIFKIPYLKCSHHMHITGLKMMVTTKWTTNNIQFTSLVNEAFLNANLSLFYIFLHIARKNNSIAKPWGQSGVIKNVLYPHSSLHFARNRDHGALYTSGFV